MNSKHLNVQLSDQTLLCKICQKTFKNYTAKSNHMRMHRDQRPFVCTVCKRAFLWEISFKGHLKAHARRLVITKRMADGIYQKAKTVQQQKKNKCETDSTRSPQLKAENCKQDNGNDIKVNNQVASIPNKKIVKAIISHEAVRADKVEESTIKIDLANANFTNLNDNIRKSDSAPMIIKVRVGNNQGELKGQQGCESASLKDKFKTAQISMNQRFQKMKKVD
ncbi:putative zinc finger protein [Trichinella pseudospiralis]|uniref:Putative zinc finger protein n=1 Tax=Trichinella pseudospiralis TaxID=6337 RepID=A0A0V1JIV4_TRIPS|nr:putative zinc finger protein [Trichinella pseudospiralis]KRZ34896.1 putative zinc finger protein [Trichinella pseudospiralis]